MPNSFFEVEHSTDIQNSVAKFCDLQDFHSRFLIVAPKNRRGQFDKVMSRTAFKDIKARVAFHSYEDISKQYELPLGRESQHPTVETVHPYRVVGHPACQRGHPVRAVPFGKLFKIGSKGMVFTDAA